MGLRDFLKRKGTAPEPEQAEIEALVEETDIPVEEIDIFAEPETPSELEALLEEIADYTPEILPTASGLLPQEVLLLDYAPSLYTDQEEFPAFWSQQYGIDDVPHLLSELTDREFLAQASLEETLYGATVIRLRQVLKANRLPVAGKKAELIARLLAGLSEDTLNEHFPRRTFTLTADGYKACDEAVYIPYIHRRPVEGLTIYSLHQLVAEHPEKSWRELVLAHLETCANRHRMADDFAAYRATRYRMYQFFMEENKLKKAFPQLSEVIYYDLSGVISGVDPLYRYISEKYFFPYDTSIVKLSAVHVQAMGRLKEQLHLSEEMLKALLMQFFNHFSAPFHLFTVEECAIIVLLEIRGDKDRLRQVYEMAERRFGQRH
ncbi:MAG: DNA-binding protein [Oscillospiraceae bacterium]|nr:DNA-binding protein [Oscillospiraceae bacterium]